MSENKVAKYNDANILFFLTSQTNTAIDSNYVLNGIFSNYDPFILFVCFQLNYTN